MSIAWGEVKVSNDTSQNFEMGKLSVEVSRSPLEWIVEYRYLQDRYVNESVKANSRFRTISNNEGASLKIEPSTADRNVVVRPQQTIHIPPGETIDLFIGTPLWLKATVIDSGYTLFDLPVQILSDTWFGSNTRSGEVCYANQTQARLYLEKLSQQPEKLITPVNIRNEGDDTLTIERLNLPIPYLSVYDTGKSLWTQQVKIRRTGQLASAEIQFSAEAPHQFREATFISPPRIKEHSNLVVRAMGLLFDEKHSK